MSCWLETKSWEEAQIAIEESKGVAIVPIGSVEQHSTHLPLGTDSYVAITLAEDAGEKTKAVVVPPVWYGWSPHHMVRPGTITIRPETLIDLTYDIIASLAQHGLKKIILINGHRIVNVVWMQLCAERAQRELGVTIKIFDPAYMSKDIVGELELGPVGHDTLCYVPSTFEHAKKSAEIAGGSTGCPTKSDAEKGRIYHEHLIKNLVAVIESLQNQE